MPATPIRLPSSGSLPLVRTNTLIPLPLCFSFAASTSFGSSAGVKAMRGSTFIGTATITAAARRVSPCWVVTRTRSPCCSTRVTGVDSRTSGLPSSSIALIRLMVPSLKL
ncbi:hypothetical protein D3C81_1701310 [compost metagenome]